MSNPPLHVRAFMPGRAETLWRWTIFCVVLLTIPEFYIELVAKHLREEVAALRAQLRTDRLIMRE